MKLSTIALATVATAGSGALGLLEKRVVGGSAVASSDYSFVTNIIVSSSGSGKDTSVCTGALISPNTVITSAACVADTVSDKAVAVNTVIVGQGVQSTVVGNATVSLAQAVAQSGYVYAKEIHVHPGYNSIAYTDNVAVVVLSQPLGSAASVAKLISKPNATAKTAYTAVGWGSTNAEAGGLSTPATASFASKLQQVQLSVGTKAACTDVWASYANLTNSLCLTPVKTSANVCNGDGLLVKQANDKSMGIAGLLNIVAVKGDVPAETCNNIGATDFFTTFANYVSWITQITPLKSSDFVSSASFSYGAASSSDDSDAASEEGSLSDDGKASGSASESEDDESLIDHESSHSSSASSTAVLAAAAAPLAVLLALF
ncbi:hypothetical protein IW150_002828 [Coemansia sp. RSA 2607]|nr:hypothetical protein IW150_002828 [Coemansia sp. RSA 2607]